MDLYLIPKACGLLKLAFVCSPCLSWHVDNRRIVLDKQIHTIPPASYQDHPNSGTS